MRILFLLACWHLLGCPLKPEKHTVTLDKTGAAVLQLKRAHEHTACSYENAVSVSEVAGNQRKLELHGKPGDKVLVTCR